MSDDDYRRGPGRSLDRRFIEIVRPVAVAVQDCALCDEHGYRGTIPCDHIDHYAENAAGRAAVRAALAEIASRKRPVVRDDTPDVVARQRAAAPAQTLEDQ